MVLQSIAVCGETHTQHNEFLMAACNIQIYTLTDGRWAVWKTGTTMTANFSSPRSLAKFYARQNPKSQFVVPEGFRPTSHGDAHVDGDARERGPHAAGECATGYLRPADRD